MNTREMAEKLDTDPKRLRRFLRADATYRNAGQGGRYEFTDKDVPTLRKRFAAWVEKTAKAAEAKASASTAPRARRRVKGEVPPMSSDIAKIPAGKLTKAQRAERDRHSRARVDRLEERLKAAGLHISQRADA